MDLLVNYLRRLHILVQQTLAKLTENKERKIQRHKKTICTEQMYKT